LNNERPTIYHRLAWDWWPLIGLHPDHTGALSVRGWASEKQSAVTIDFKQLKEALATAGLLPLYDRCRKPLPTHALERHAIQICESILASRPFKYDDPLRHGSCTADGRTTATRLEGMLAALTFLVAEYNNLRKRMTVAIDDGLKFLIRSQIRTGPYAGGMPRAIQMLLEDHPQFKRSFNRRATGVRIDYVQHALGAMLQYERILFLRLTQK
jgi:hypothetical protein